MNIKDAIIGVVGFGNFGKVVCNNLFPNNSLVLFSRKKDISVPKNVVIVPSLEEITKKADMIIPCVPIRHFEEVIQELKPFLKKETLVMDICSVKEYPIHVMKKHLINTQIIATHPMFGPNSIQKRNGVLKELPVVVSNVSANAEVFDGIKQHFRSLSLDVIEMEPEEHDKLSAHSQFFALTLGELSQKLSLKPTPIDTPGAKAIFDAMGYMGADRHIIEDMLTYNTYCLPLLNNMITILSSLQEGALHD